MPTDIMAGAVIALLLSCAVRFAIFVNNAINTPGVTPFTPIGVDLPTTRFERLVSPETTQTIGLPSHVSEESTQSISSEASVVRAGTQDLSR